MYGAILGDIIGSQVEFTRPKGYDGKKAELFTNKCMEYVDKIETNEELIATVDMSTVNPNYYY